MKIQNCLIITTPDSVVSLSIDEMPHLAGNVIMSSDLLSCEVKASPTAAVGVRAVKAALNAAVIVSCVANLSACTAAQVQTALTDGQLVCQVGSAYEAMRTAAGQPVLAKGATSEAVQQVCGLVNGAAVALPSGATPASVQVTLPASVTIPLAASS